MEYARLAWSCYLANGTDIKPILALEEQKALTNPASMIVSAAMAKMVKPETLLPSMFAISSDEKTERRTR